MDGAVKAVVLAGLSPEERTSYFSHLVKILSGSYPKSNQTDRYHGHGYQVWEICEEIIPHVQSMFRILVAFEFEIPNAEEWVNLVI